jgi:UDP-glucose 4-epimerase
VEPNQSVVVGSNGFIGRKTVLQLENLGHKVACITSENRELLASRSFWAELNPNQVVWLASKITPSVAHNNPDLVREELDEFLRFVDALSGISSHVIYASSGGTVYTDTKLPFFESSQASGANEYGKSKLAMEHVLINSEIRSTILRISNAYGPGQRLNRGQGVIGTWLSQVLDGKPISVFGSLDNVRDFVFIDDVVNAVVSGIEHSDKSDVFNIGSGVGLTLNELIQQIRTVTGVNFDINQLDGRSVDRTSIWLNIDKAEEELNWKPLVTLEDGLKWSWNSLIRARKGE